MSQTLGILDYGYTGNIFNIKKSLENADKNIRIIPMKKKSDLGKIDKMILPGVGTYPNAMNDIKGFKRDLKEFMMKKPVLGICLGMQILSEKGYEFGETKGLGVLEGEVMRLAVKERIPHMGWAVVDRVKKSIILKGLAEEDTFYFMHSYEFINYKDVAGLSEYGGHKFVSVVEKGSIFGVQFHPEKSGKSGLKILKNFVNL